MVYVRTRKFCCCLPVRFGVFVLGILCLVGGGLIAGAGWLIVSRLNQVNLTFSDQVALYIVSVLYTILAVASVFGLIGASIKNIGMVSCFATVLAIHLCFSIASGIYALVSIFRQNSQDALNTCLNGASDSASITACRDGIAIMKGVSVAVFVVVCLIELYAYFIIDRYASQLEEEVTAKDTDRIINQISRPAPVTITTYGTPAYGAPVPPNGYAFSSPRAAFGPPLQRHDPGSAV